MTAWRTLAVAAGVSAMVLAGPADAAEISLMSPGAVEEVLDALIPSFERATGHKVVIISKSSGDVFASVRAGDFADLAISSGAALDTLVKEGRVVAGSRVDFVRTRIGVAVRAGAPKPDISTPEAFRKTLLAAKSVGYSTGPSGAYIVGLVKQLGISDQVKLVQAPPRERVGTILARGEVELGVQQISELLPMPGIDFVGPLPDALQTVLVYSLGIPTTAKERDAAAALTKFLTSETALPVLKKLGMEPG